MESLLAQAIDDRRLVAFSYHGYQRIAEPHVLGYQAGQLQLLTFQIGGDSSSGDLPDWRRVRVDEVRELQILDERFAGPRPGPSGKRSSFDQIIAFVS